jgi:hypothetical protein
MRELSSQSRVLAALHCAAHLQTQADAAMRRATALTHSPVTHRSSSKGAALTKAAATATAPATTSANTSDSLKSGVLYGPEVPPPAGSI